MELIVNKWSDDFWGPGKKYIIIKSEKWMKRLYIGDIIWRKHSRYNIIDLFKGQTLKNCLSWCDLRGLLRDVTTIKKAMEIYKNVFTNDEIEGGTFIVLKIKYVSHFSWFNEIFARMLDYSFGVPNEKECIDFLGQLKYVDPNYIIGINKFTILQLAINKNFISLALKLCDKNDDINYVNKYGHTALSLACQKGNLTLVKNLVSNYGQSLKLSWDRMDYSPLLLACQNGCEGMVKLLVENYGLGCMPHFEDYKLRTALWWATYMNKYDIVSILLNHFGDKCLPGRGSVDGFTPLINSVSNGNLEMVKLIIKYKSSSYSYTVNGDNCLMIACDKGFEDIGKLIIETYGYRIIPSPSSMSLKTRNFIAKVNPLWLN